MNPETSSGINVRDIRGITNSYLNAADDIEEKLYWADQTAKIPETSRVMSSGDMYLEIAMLHPEKAQKNTLFNKAIANWQKVIDRYSNYSDNLSQDFIGAGIQLANTEIYRHLIYDVSPSAGTIIKNQKSLFAVGRFICDETAAATKVNKDLRGELNGKLAEIDVQLMLNRFGTQISNSPNAVDFFSTPALYSQERGLKLEDQPNTNWDLSVFARQTNDKLLQIHKLQIKSSGSALNHSKEYADDISTVVLSRDLAVTKSGKIYPKELFNDLYNEFYLANFPVKGSELLDQRTEKILEIMDQTDQRQSNI